MTYELKYIIDIQPSSLCFVAKLTTFLMLYSATFFRSLLSYSVTLEFQTELFIQSTEVDFSHPVYNPSARANSGIELTTSRKVDIFQPIIDSVTFGVNIAIKILSRDRKVKHNKNSSFKQICQELKIDLIFFYRITWSSIPWRKTTQRNRIE